VCSATEERVAQAGQLGIYMEAGTGLHLLACANVLRRPVVLIASRAHMEDTTRSNCGTYLPARVGPGQLATRVPILVAWQTGAFAIGGAGPAMGRLESFRRRLVSFVWEIASETY
jgi:hypothetical protein